jgi:hypothetical protein
MMWRIEGTAAGYHFTVYIRAPSPAKAIEKAESLFRDQIVITLVVQSEP